LLFFLFILLGCCFLFVFSCFSLILVFYFVFFVRSGFVFVCFVLFFFFWSNTIFAVLLDS
jgi:hypothetical protein